MKPNHRLFARAIAITCASACVLALPAGHATALATERSVVNLGFTSTNLNVQALEEFQTAYDEALLANAAAGVAIKRTLAALASAYEDDTLAASGAYENGMRALEDAQLEQARSFFDESAASYNRSLGQWVAPDGYAALYLARAKLAFAARDNVAARREFARALPAMAIKELSPTEFSPTLQELFVETLTSGGAAPLNPEDGGLLGAAALAMEASWVFSGKLRQASNAVDVLIAATNASGQTIRRSGQVLTQGGDVAAVVANLVQQVSNDIGLTPPPAGGARSHLTDLPSAPKPQAVTSRWYFWVGAAATAAAASAIIYMSAQEPVVIGSGSGDDDLVIVFE